MKSFRHILIFLSVFLIPASFVLQIIFSNRFMMLLPYFSILIALATFNTLDIKLMLYRNPVPKLLILLVLIILFSHSYQLSFLIINIETFIRSSIPLLALIFFIFFYGLDLKNSEINSALFAILAFGVCSGVYFIYEHAQKFIFFNIPEYSKLAYQYSLLAKGGDSSELSAARISLGSRSFGLLQTHTISSFYIIAGLISSVYLFSKQSLFVSKIIVFNIFAIGSLNFSTIAISLFLTSFYILNGWKIIHGLLSISLSKFILFFILATLLFFIFLSLYSPGLLNFLENLVSFQFQLIFQYGDEAINFSQTNNFITQYKENFLNYLQSIDEFPILSLIGSGFTGVVYSRSGDTGFIESISYFGIFSVAIMVFYIITWLAEKNKKIISETIVLKEFCFFLLVVALIIYDFHYSIWASVYIFPIIMIFLGIYLNPCINGSISIQNRHAQ